MIRTHCTQRKVNEISQHGHRWCGGGGRQTAVATSSHKTLGIKTETGWILQVRLVARGFERTVSTDTDFYAGTPKLTTVRALLTIAAIQGNPMPSESEPVYVEPAPEAELDSSKVWLCKNAFQGLKISPEAWVLHSTQKINDMSYNQLISFDVRSDDSILLRHMDVVGTDQNNIS